MEWDWTFITAISSVLGVVGGLISVVFLIFEVRHNAHAIEGATVQSLMTLEADVFGMVADNAELYLRGNAALDSLTPAERLRYDRIIGTQMSLYYSAWVQLQEGLMDDEVWEAYLNAIRDALSAPGAAEVWRGLASHYPKSFRERIAV